MLGSLGVSLDILKIEAFSQVRKQKRAAIQPDPVTRAWLREITVNRTLSQNNYFASYIKKTD